MADIRHNIVIKAAPEKIYEAISTQQGIEAWWCKQTIAKPEVGFVNVFVFGSSKNEMRVTALDPNKKAEWHVTDSKLSFLADQDEWTGTKIIFEIEQVNDKTRVRFIHQGLTPQIECYQQCSNGWSGYLQRLKLSHTAPTI